MANTLALPAYPRYRWAVLAVVVVGQVVAAGFYLCWPALTTFIRDDFGLTREQVGLIVGATGAGSALGSAPLGSAGDRFGARRVLTVGLLAMALLAVLSTLSPTFVVLFAGVAAAGLAYGAITPAGVKVLVSWFPPRELGTAIACKQLGYPLGGALVAATLPALTLALGSWRPAVALVSILIAASAFAVLAVISERSSRPRRAAGPTGRWWTPLLRRNVLLLSLVGLLYAGLNAAWLGALVLYAQEGLKLPVTVGAGLLALCQFAAVPGRFLVGVLSDRLFGGRRRGLLIFCGVVGALVAAVLPLFTAPSPLLLGGLVVVFGLTGGSWTPLQHAALASDGEERSSGATVGFGIGINSIGNLVFPPLFGRAVDTLGSYTPAWEGIALAGLVGALLMLAVREGAAGRGLGGVPQ